MYTYGFTSGIATALVPVLGLSYPALTVGLVGGAAAALADTSILLFLRQKMQREIREVAASRPMRALGKIPGLRSQTGRTVLGILVLASPLPDEIGVALVASSRVLSAGKFLALSFGSNSLGLYVLARIGQAVL